MGFFDALKRVLGGPPIDPTGAGPSRDLAAAWGLTGDGADDGDSPPSADSDHASAYDRAQWLRRLKRVLADLPASQPLWADLMADAGALHIEPDWLAQAQKDEFLLLIRNAVSDRRVTEAEHRKLDLARDLIGIPEAEAEAALHEIAKEAESFFGKTVEGA